MDVITIVDHVKDDSVRLATGITIDRKVVTLIGEHRNFVKL